jgi:hypothetical protein
LRRRNTIVSISTVIGNLALQMSASRTLDSIDQLQMGHSPGFQLREVEQILKHGVRQNKELFFSLMRWSAIAVLLLRPAILIISQSERREEKESIV